MNVELYKSSLNNIKDCIAIYKVLNNGEDFHFVFFNNAAEKLEDIKEEEILNKSVLNIFPGIKDFGLFEVFQNVYKSGNKTYFPIKIYKDNRIEGFRDNIILKIDEKHIMAIYSDKTEEKISEEKLNQTLSFLNSYEIALNTSSIVSKADLQGNITYVNDNFCKITGYSKKEVIGKPHNILRHPDNDKKIFKDLWDTITSKKVWHNTIKNKDRYNNDYWIDISIIPILDSKNRIIEYISVRHDITKTIKQQNHLKKTVNFDSLTGLGNKYKLQNDIKKSTKHSLAIINIDNFSEVNDFYGHKIGDLILKVFSDKLKVNIVNNTYKLYRLHADEFVIFNSEVASEVFLSNLTVTISKLKKEVFKLKKEEIHFTFTVAISFENRENILSCASMALKKAKKESHDMLIYNKSMSLNDKYKNNIKWTKKIKKALDDNNFIPVYQSIVSNVDKKVEKYECLARLKEENKLISPFYFLELSKTNKQYLRISKMIIRKSFDTLSKNRVPFSLNLTIEDILNDNMKDFIYEMLEVYKIGELITFEIVESESIKNFNKVLAFIQKVKAYNCKIAIDDFGTGYSNFEYLIKLKADYIKIDGSLIKNITVDPISEKVVKNLALFAKDLGMKTIAEFVENESIFNKVKELGIDYSQGYYFSEPNVTLL